MNLKNPLRLALLVLFTCLPSLALASDLGTDRCATPYPFWWRHLGNPELIAVKDIAIDAQGEDFAVTLTLVNLGREPTLEGTVVAVTQSAHLAKGYENPSLPEPPEDPGSLVGSEEIALVKLPALRPEESFRVSGLARGFGRDLHHVLSVNVYDQGLMRLDPEPQPWREWVRVLGPSTAPGSLQVVRSTVAEVASDRPGYKALAIQLSLQNVGRESLQAGLPVLMAHDNASTVSGNPNPDDDFNPNDPGNPYLSVYREWLYQGRLETPVAPGGLVNLSGIAYVTGEASSFEVVTVAVGP